MRAGKTIHLKDAADGRFQYPESAKSETPGFCAVCPAYGRRQGRGLMRVYSAEEREFSADEVTFMEAVAAISALAIENSRLHGSPAQQLRSHGQTRLLGLRRLGTAQTGC